MPITKFLENNAAAYGDEVCLVEINPELKEKGENPFTLDSKDPTGDYQAFILGETRYASLKKTQPAVAEELFKKTEESSKERLAGYKRIAGKE